MMLMTQAAFMDIDIDQNKMETQQEKIEKKDEWRLKSLKIEFKPGYSFDNTEDRYEGVISFENGEHESFQFRVRPDMADDYIKLISADIVRCAESLGTRLIESLGLKKNE